MATNAVRLSRTTLWIINTTFALALVFVFMLMVMTAIAQQEVISRLKADQVDLGYGAALSVRDKANERQLKLDALAEAERERLTQYRDAQTRWKETGRIFDDAWESLLPYLQRIARSKICEITLPADNSISARVTALNEYRECLDNAGSSRSVTSAKQAAEEFERALNGHRVTNRAFLTSEDRLKETRVDIESGALTPVQEKVRNSFEDMKVLLSGWLLLGGGLVAMPPALLQILLTFFSGLFGAVLITFILLVYPNVINVTNTKETYSRIFLGGMIALCVYIVLLFASTVLGTNTGIIAAGTNYMAFCGIGILAGMFSDRAAGWLSDRANSFFKRGQAGQASNPALPPQAPAPPPPPPPPPPQDSASEKPPLKGPEGGSGDA